MARLNPLPLICLLAALADAQQPAAVSIEDSQALSLASGQTGQTYGIQVLLPPSYDETDKRYPVLYVLDGQWDFKLLAGMVGGLAYDVLMPQVIVVGITYAAEPEDLHAWRSAHYLPDQGSAIGAGRFLSFIRRELIPFVEKRYRVDAGDRTLLGSSLAGFFTLYALFHETDLFQRYISSSPSLWWGEEGQAVFAYEKQYAAGHADLPVRLSLTVGALEEPEGMVAPNIELAEILRQRAYPGLDLHAALIDDAKHASVKPLAYTRGLVAVFHRKGRHVAPPVLEAYVGTYRAGTGDEAFAMQIALDAGQLFYQSQYDKQPVPLHALSATRFFSRQRAMEISFSVDAEGVCRKLTIHEAAAEWDMARVD